MLNETRTKILPQLSSVRTEADKSYVQKSVASPPCEDKSFPEIIPSSSTRYAINDQIELIHPLNYTCKPTLMKYNGFQNYHTLNGSKLRSDSPIELENTLAFINSPSNDIKNVLNQPLNVQSPLEMNPTMTYSFIPVEREKVLEVSYKNTERTFKRRVQNYGKLLKQ